MLEGYLLVDKPMNWTSFDVVNYVRKLISSKLNIKPKTIKVGHSGTLDPMATGLLILLIGKKYTSKANQFIKKDKVYDVQLKLGYQSASFDLETNPLKVSNRRPTYQNVQKKIDMFVGETIQTPPVYSAKKINGKRLYEFARKNQKPLIKPQNIKVYWIKKLRYEYPFIEFRIKVSSGTYIRSLVSDIGIKLKTGALMTRLRRVQIGNFDLKKSLEINNLTYDDIVNNILI